MQTTAVPAHTSVSLLTWADAGARLGVGRTTIFRLIREGELDAVHLSQRMTRIRSDSVDRYIDRLSGTVNTK